MARSSLSSVLRCSRQVALLAERVAVTDGDLLSRFVNERDEAAFESLLLRHGAMVLGVCRRILRSEADAHDAFQATFLVFLRKAGSIQPRAMVGNWLYGVAQRTSLKARALRRMPTLSWADQSLASGDASRDQVQAELRDLLDWELSQLPDKYRAPVVLCELEGRSIKEAAQALDCPVGTVASRLARGRDLLAKRLTRQGFVISGAALAGLLASKAASAAVPARLCFALIEAATAATFDGSLGVGIVSSEVSRMAAGALKTMSTSRFQWAIAVCMSISLLVTGGSLFLYRASAAEEKSTPSAALTPTDDKSEKREPNKPAQQEPKTSARTRGYLGVGLARDSDGNPASIYEVAPDSPASKAGVMKGDVVLKMNKIDAKDRALVANTLKALKPGDKVTLRLKRGDKEMDVSITLGQWPADFKEDSKRPNKPSAKVDSDHGFLGLKLRSEKATGTVVIDGLASESPAAKAGVKPGDILLKVDDQTVKSARIERLAGLKAGDQVKLRLKRDKRELDVTITAGKWPADFPKM
jgi:RNA polymerase sigma factor (sigma-70 family)